VVSCGSSDSNKNQAPATNDDGTCKPVGTECKAQGYTEIALCKNKDETQFWYLVCTDAGCTTGDRIDCNGTDCGDAVSSAIAVCQPQLDH
jgi:hypothetical protein